MTAFLILGLLLWAGADWHKRRKFVFALFAGLALLWLSGAALWPNWIPQWLHIVFGYRRYSTPPLPVDLFGRYAGIVLIAVLLAGALALAWRTRRVSPTSPQFVLTFSILLAVTAVALFPGQAVYDHIVLLPAILLLVRSGRVLAAANRGLRVVLFITAGAIAWQWVAALVVIGMRWIQQPPPPLASPVWLLPVRTAASVPFAILACLGLMVRHRLAKSNCDFPERSAK